MKIMKDGILWGKCSDENIRKYNLSVHASHAYYFYWWNWLQPKDRYWGFGEFWYDQPHRHFGFWFFNWSWSTQWTPVPKDW